MEAILNQEVVYLYSIPFFSGVILLEILYSYLGNKELYTKHDTLTNLIFAVVNILLDLLMKGFSFWILSFFYHRKLFELSHGSFYWIACFVITDFLYYIHHCVDHKSRFFWAVHVTHHNSDHFNITTGFRSPVLQPLYRYLFFIPAAWMGFEPLHIMFCYALGLDVWNFDSYAEHRQARPFGMDFHHPFSSQGISCLQHKISGSQYGYGFDFVG